MLRALPFVLLLTAAVTNPGQKPQTATPAQGKADNPVSQSTPSERPSHWYASPEWWLVILGFPTLVVVGWQSFETHRAAAAANRTLISMLRPKVIVRRIGIHRGTRMPTLGVPDKDPWRVEFEVANIGGSRARITEYSFTLTRETQHTHVPYSLRPQGTPFVLEPGEEKLMFILIEDSLVGILRLLGETGLREGYQDTDKLFFWGRLRYLDDLGISRNTAVHRHYKSVSELFEVVKDSELDYAD